MHKDLQRPADVGFRVDSVVAIRAPLRAEQADAVSIPQRPRGDAKFGGCFTDGIFAHGFHFLRRRSVKVKSSFHDNVMTPRTCPPHVPMTCRRNREKCTRRLHMSMRCTRERIRHGIRPKPPLKEGNCIYGRRTTPTLRAPKSPKYASL